VKEVGEISCPSLRDLRNAFPFPSAMPGEWQSVPLLCQKPHDVWNLCIFFPPYKSFKKQFLRISLKFPNFMNTFLFVFSYPVLFFETGASYLVFFLNHPASWGANVWCCVVTAVTAMPFVHSTVNTCTG